MDNKQETKVIDLGNKEMNVQEEQKSKKADGGRIDISDLKKEVMKSFSDNASGPEQTARQGMNQKKTPEKKQDPAHTENDAPDPGGKGAKKTSLDKMSHEEFLALYGEGSSEEDSGDDNGIRKTKGSKESKESKEKKSPRLKKKRRNLIKTFRDKITDESIDDESAKMMVNIIGIVGGLAFIVVVTLAAVFIYGQYSSFSASMKRRRTMKIQATSQTRQAVMKRPLTRQGQEGTGSKDVLLLRTCILTNIPIPMPPSILNRWWILTREIKKPFKSC